MGGRMWFEEFIPQSLNELSFNEKANALIRTIGEKKVVPHIIFHGPRGAGKQTRARLLVQTLFNSNDLKLKYDSITVDQKTELRIVNSQYHTELYASEFGVKDRVYVQEVVKQLCIVRNAMSYTTGGSDKPKFRVFIVFEAETLSLEAQASLRRTMEAYAENSKFMFVTENLNGIINPIRSRCAAIRIGSPSRDEMTVALGKLPCMAPVDVINKIIDESNHDMLMATVMLQRWAMTNKIQAPSWKTLVYEISDLIIGNSCIDSLRAVKGHLNELYVKCVDLGMVLEELIILILTDKRTPAKHYQTLTKLCSYYSCSLAQGNNEVVHILAFISYSMFVLQVK